MKLSKIILKVHCQSQQDKPKQIFNVTMEHGLFMDNYFVRPGIFGEYISSDDLNWNLSLIPTAFVTVCLRNLSSYV